MKSSLYPKLFQLVTILLFSSLLLQQCANPVMPGGGPKDIDPPQVVVAIPANYSVNFDAKKIEITFNEFVKVAEMQKNLLVSPPVKKNPEFRLRGKTLQIIFEEPLLKETTYTLFFGDAIVDLTEGNPLSGFNYVFSTGQVLDSMSIGGIVLNAFDLDPPEQAYVMLYASIPDTIVPDSAPYLLRPRYITRTDENGHFRLNNLKDTVYQLFALSDMNSNLLYDMPGEKIAFLDSLIHPVYDPPLLHDSTILLKDSLIADTVFTDKSVVFDTAYKAMQWVADSLADSLSHAESLKPELDIMLFMFEEQDSLQRLLRAEKLRPGLLQFAFRYPVKELKITELRPFPEGMEVIEVFSPDGDTLQWFYPPQISDSVFLLVQQDSVVNDTVILSLADKERVGNRRKKEEVEKKPVLGMTTNAKARKLDLPKRLQLRFDEPVVEVNMRDTNWLVINQDTLFNQLRFIPFDSNGFVFQLDTTFQPESRVMIRFPDSVFFGFSGKTNDSTQLNFSVPALDQYGNLYLDLILPKTEHGFLVQLMNEKETVLNEKQLLTSTRLEYLYLIPGNYMLKAIFDRNSNGHWDTGDYLKKLQPEKVVYFSKILEIRANWDLQEQWELHHNAP